MTIDNAKKHRQEFGYQCDALIDSEHRLVKLTGATITPEVAVISPKGQLLDAARSTDAHSANQCQPIQSLAK